MPSAAHACSSEGSLWLRVWGPGGYIVGFGLLGWGIGCGVRGVGVWKQSV
jgi:hypothetical protein